MHHVTFITAAAGLFFGFVGTILGIINTWRNFLLDRTKIKVVPIWLVGSEDERAGMSIEITNLSVFPVTISQIGFTDKRGRHDMPVSEGFIVGRGRLPERMEPRTFIAALASLATCESDGFLKIDRAYADTACGRRFTGTSSHLRKQIELVSLARK